MTTAQSGPVADLQHLLDLLGLLPDRDDERSSFWSDVAGIEPYGWSDFRGEFTRYNLTNVKPETAGDLAQACLAIFDGEQPTLWGLLSARLGYAARDNLAPGRRWCEDLCATAWRLYLPLHLKKVRELGLV